MMSDEMRGLLAALAERLDRAGISGGIRVVGGSAGRLARIRAAIARQTDSRARSSREPVGLQLNAALAVKPSGGFHARCALTYAPKRHRAAVRPMTLEARPPCRRIEIFIGLAMARLPSCRTPATVTMCGLRIAVRGLPVMTPEVRAMRSPRGSFPRITVGRMAARRCLAAPVDAAIRRWRTSSTQAKPSLSD